MTVAEGNQQALVYSHGLTTSSSENDDASNVYLALSQHVARTQALVAINNLQTWNGNGDFDSPIKVPGAYIGIPLVVPDQDLVAVICVIDRRTRRWSKAHKSAVELIAGALALTIKTAAAPDQQLERSHRDQLVMHEMNHRVRNLMSVVSSVCTQTLAQSTSLSEASEKLQERIMSMARCHEALTRSDWTNVSLNHLIAEEVRAYSDRVSIQGPPFTIAAKSAQMVAMIIHELATNALKYGALSNPDGKVDVSWERADDKMKLRWVESGGPIVQMPESTGFGHSIIERAAAHEFETQPEINFDLDGFKYSLLFPIEF